MNRMRRRDVIVATLALFVLFVFVRLRAPSPRSALFADYLADSKYDNDEDLVSEVDDEARWPRRDGKRISQIIAEEKIVSLWQKLGNGRGPFIVGGIGDSGTRGFWDVMMKLGVYMQGQDNVRGDSRDSLVFMAQRFVTQSDGTRISRSPAALYNEPIIRSRSIKYNSSHVRPERWQIGRQYIADMIEEVMNDTISKKAQKSKEEPLYPFGFKHPRTALLLPYFVATLGNKFAFIHVLRDGREVASGDNNYLFMDHCKLYYGSKCDTSKAIDMWADLNQEVFEFALESKMKANQYFAMRVEDLVLGQSACYENLVRFLDLQQSASNNVTERMQRAMKSSMSHSKSYFGQKYTYYQRLDMLNVRSKKAREALKFWGYSETKFELGADCRDMPWMKEFRRRKGKLPTDDDDGR